MAFLIRKELCINCGTCIPECPAACIRASIDGAVVITELCIDCGICVLLCGNKALEKIGDEFRLTTYDLTDYL